MIDNTVSGIFTVVARVRRGRVFHPTGVPLAGMVHAVDPQFVKLLGTTERPAAVRISKGTGLPGGLPDVLGLALRVLDRDDRPWDLTLATTGTSAATRLLPLPVRGWKSANYGSLMPYRFEDGPALWLGARPAAPQPDTADLSDFNSGVSDGGTGFELTATSRSGPSRTLAHLVVSELEVGAAPTYFDPIRNRPAGVELLPRALATIREWAYVGSRSGRGRSADADYADSLFARD
ncbi:phosphodiesterase [Nocardia sp. NPDC005978]|uniref:phosphodiesterase n=1 Tax=Nocardia sp. NPDC005978 TaxID=3156725 RepID=UPI00339F2845